MAKTNVPRNILDPEMPFMSASLGNNKTPLDQNEAYHAWKQDDTPNTRSNMLRAMQPDIDKAVKSYAGERAGPTVKNQAKLLAMDAMRSYDPNTGSIQTHLLSQLRRLYRTSAQSQNIIRVPEQVTLDRRHLREAEEELTDRLGRTPSDAEIANFTGLSVKRMQYIRGINMPTNTGSILDETGEVFSPASTVPGNTTSADAWAEMIYYDLGHVDQAIMDMTLGLHGSPALSNSEIAKRLNITQGAVSQRKNKIQGLLDMQSSSPFGE